MKLWLIERLSRDELRTILHDHFDDEFEARFVGKQRHKTHRTPLYSLSPWHEEHSDRHEKLAEQGLKVGAGISLPIYRSKDQFSAWVHVLIVMPNVRHANAIAHYYLDLVEGRGCKCLNIILLIGIIYVHDRHNLNTAHHRSRL